MNMLFFIIGMGSTLGALLFLFLYWGFKRSKKRVELSGLKELAYMMLAVGLVLVVVTSFKQAHGAEVPLPPQRYTHGELGTFGTYSNKWLAKRWRTMCRGPARYQAMSEAYNYGMPNPCGER